MSEEYVRAVHRIDALWKEAFKDLWIPAEWVDPNEMQVPWPRNQGSCTPGEPGYRHGEHERRVPPCYECVGISSFKHDQDPDTWCECGPKETCKGPCRRHAHDPSFHSMPYAFSEEQCWAQYPGTCPDCSEARPWAPGDSRWVMWVGCYDRTGGLCECSCHEGQIVVGGPHDPEETLDDTPSSP